MIDGNEEAYCELKLSPNVQMIATVRRFVGDQRVLADDGITSRLVVATHERLAPPVRSSIDGLGLVHAESAMDRSCQLEDENLVRLRAEARFAWNRVSA